MIRDVSTTYSGQYVKGMLDARREAMSKGEKFDPQEFRIQIPDAEKSEFKVGEADKPKSYVMDYLGDDEVLEKIRSFDVNSDGKIGFLEHSRMLEFEANTQKKESVSNLDQEGLYQLLKVEIGLDIPKDMIEVYFDRFDLDDDGMLSPEELEKAIQYIVEETEKKLEQERKSKEKIRKSKTLSQSEFVTMISTGTNNTDAKSKYDRTLRIHEEDRKLIASA